jgi:uncharacterized protein
MPVPGLALKAAFGSAAQVMLDSQRAVPARLAALGFTHRFVRAEDALAEIFGVAPRPPAQAPPSPYQPQHHAP